MPPIIPIPNDIPENGSIEENGHTETDSINVVSDTDSETDEENAVYEGYEPLSQDPDTFLDNQCVFEEENFSLESDLIADEVNVINHHSLILSPQETSDITSINSLKADDFKMDEKHIETIKSVMKGITLPSSNLPQWATVVPEEEWKTNVLSEMLLRQVGNSNNKTKCNKSVCDEHNTDTQNDIPR